MVYNVNNDRQQRLEALLVQLQRTYNSLVSPPASITNISTLRSRTQSASLRSARVLSCRSGTTLATRYVVFGSPSRCGPMAVVGGRS